MIYLVLVIALVTLAFVSKQFWAAKTALKKYQPIIEVDRAIHERSEKNKELEQRLVELGVSCEKLEKDISIFRESSDLYESGFYESKYDFEHSKDYEDKLDVIREKQKKMIKEQTAIECKTEWRVGDSRAEGKKMTDRTIKLGLSAFNVQCDNEILKVRFDNINKASDRIHKIRETVNKLLETSHCTITLPFVTLKLEELWLAYEFQQKLQAEKDEQKALREQMREEEKARREAERAEADAVLEEKRYSKALEKAKSELENKSEEQKATFLAKIAELEFKLKEAQENKERAKSMAEQTKMGHVYIISNIGSFGEDIYKIGMTRRLDPLDRIDELGDASVPFEFDIHALIKCDDAPMLERTLHQKFANRRVNRINERKEFFRVSLAEVEQECRAVHRGEIKLTLVAEAKDFRQTIAIQAQETNEKKSA